jgi:integrase
MLNSQNIYDQSLNDLWKELSDHAIITSGTEEELLELFKMAKQVKLEQEILQKHIENYYHIWTNNKGVYLSYLPDPSKPKGRKSVSATTREKLERKIIDFYLNRDREEKANEKRQKLSTLRKLYPEWLNYKSLETTAPSYIRRIDSDWTKYYADDPIIDMEFTSLSKAYLKEWALTKIRECDLTKTQYYNMSIIIRQSLDYAVDRELILVNPFSQFKLPAKLFRKVKKPEDNTQVFLTTERPLIEAEAWKDFYDKECTSALAIPFAFQTGVRLGELIAIKSTDISADGKYLHIQRMVQRVEEKMPDGTWKLMKWSVTDHAKTSAGDRYIYLTEEARKIVKLILDTNHKYHDYDQDYLFVHGGKRISHQAVDCRIRKYCRHININAKSTHKIRKSYISSLIDAGININEIRKQVGHEDEHTTLRNYTFNRKESTENEADIERALAG